MALIQIEETPKWKKVLGYVGPGFLVSVAYLDPGNLQTDLQGGANHKFELLWIVLVGLIFAFIIQSRSANLGVVTGKHLAEHCKLEYPKPARYCLWFLAELSVIAADIPEVIGTAFALNILLQIPIWGGVLLAGLNTLLLLGLQRYGIRKLEIAIVVMVMVVGSCFFTVMVGAKPNIKQLLTGVFVPTFHGKLAVRDAVALLGALIMPHNFFLHSALVISRKFPHSVEGIKSASKYFLIESGVALFLAFAINVAVISVTGSVCSDPNLPPPLIQRYCHNITLDSASFLLKNALGNWSSKLFAISLLACGQSSTVTGTYAGQFIMQGFLDLKMKLWVRNLVTRFISIAPSLMACLIGGSSGAAMLIIISSMVLSFELPFALIPLLKFTSSKATMGQHKSSLSVTIASWLLGFGSIAINLYFLITIVREKMDNNDLPKAVSILVPLIVFPLMLLYIALLLYLTWKKVSSSIPSPELEITSTSTSAISVERRPDGASFSSNNNRPGELETDEIVCA